MLASIFMLALAAPLAAAGALPHLTGKEGNFTISDMSAMLVYAPSASGPAETAWNQTYSGISWSDYTPFFPVDSDGGVVPSSAHTTRFPGASVSLPFLGTAVYFYGSAKGSVDFEVGGKTSQVSLNVQDGLIASATGLENVMQNAVLKLGEGTLTVTSVIVTVQLGGQGAVITNQTFNAYGEDATSYFNSPNITWSAETGRDWVPNATVCGEYKTVQGSGSSCWSNPRIQTDVPQASFILRPPANTSFLALYTISNSEQGPFTVTLDPPLFDGPATTSYTQNNVWLAQPNVVMFFTPLDFRKSYTVTVTFTGEAGQYLEFRYGRTITTVGGDMAQPGVNPEDNASGGNTSGDAKAGPNKSSVPLGAIIGAAVGGGVALLLVGLLIFFCCRRRRQKAEDKHVAPLGGKRGGKFRRPPSGLSNFEEEAADPDKDVFVIDRDDSVNGASVTPLGAHGPSGARDNVNGNSNQNAMSHAAIAKAQEAGMEARYASTPYATPPAAYHPAGSHTSDSKGSHSFSGQPSSPTYLDSGSGRGGSAGFHTAQSPSTPLSGPMSDPMSPQQCYGSPIPPHYHSHPQQLNQQTYQQPGGFFVANASHSGSPTSEAGPHVGRSRSPRQGSTPIAGVPHHAEVKEEVDAGRVPGSRARPQETVPPRYNPMWAEEDDQHAL